MHGATTKNVSDFYNNKNNKRCTVHVLNENLKILNRHFVRTKATTEQLTIDTHGRNTVKKRPQN